MFTSADLKIDLKLNMYIYCFFFHLSENFTSSDSGSEQRSPELSMHPSKKKRRSKGDSDDR